MGFIPVQPRQTREMRERYRKVRRRQQAQGLLFGCAALLLLGGVIAIWRNISRPRKPVPAEQHAEQPRQKRAAAPALSIDLPAAPGIKVVAEQSFNSAPWLLDTDGTQLYSLTDLAPFADPGPYFTAELLAARTLRGKSAWESRGEFKAGALDYAGGMLLTLQESVSDKTLILTAYNALSGEQAWRQEVKEAAKPMLLASGKHVLLSFSAPGGVRISCFSTDTGTKVWGLKPPLRGANRNLTQETSGPALQIYESEGSIIYASANVIGFASRDSGALLRPEFAATGQLASIVIEAKRQRVFVQVRGNQSGSSSIMAIPLDGSEAWLAARVLAADNQLLFVPGPEWLLCAFRRMDNGTPRLVIECKPLTRRQELESFRHELAGGSAVCGGLVPGSNSFLVGVAAEAATASAMSEARQFYLVSPEALSVEVAGRTPQAAYAMLSFRDNLLALCDGAQLMRFDPSGRSFKLLKKLRYPQLGLRLSDDGKSLLAWSSTTEYMEGKPGEPMQAVVIR